MSPMPGHGDVCPPWFTNEGHYWRVDFAYGPQPPNFGVSKNRYRFELRVIKEENLLESAHRYSLPCQRIAQRTSYGRFALGWCFITGRIEAGWSSTDRISTVTLVPQLNRKLDLSNRRVIRGGFGQC
jgi:hypothetical protein